jgi:hypothetical protein
MNQRQLTIAGRRRFAHEDPGQLLREPVPQSAVLAHRKAVAFGQRQDKVVGVISVHGLIQSKAILENTL